MANVSKEFDKTQYNSTPSKSSMTDPHATNSAKGRGVENPIPEDSALIGDTRSELQYKALPKLVGPNFGYAKSEPSDQFRVDQGEGAKEL